MTRIVNPGRVILSTPYDRLFRPPQIMRDCRLNRIHGPLMKLLVPFAQTGGKHMILPTVQLLWIALVSTLLLLLTALTSLLVISILVSLGILKIGI